MRLPALPPLPPLKQSSRRSDGAERAHSCTSSPGNVHGRLQGRRRHGLLGCRCSHFAGSCAECCISWPCCCLLRCCCSRCRWTASERKRHWKRGWGRLAGRRAIARPALGRISTRKRRDWMANAPRRLHAVPRVKWCETSPICKVGHVHRPTSEPQVGAMAGEGEQAAAAVQAVSLQVCAVPLGCSRA